MWGCDGPGGNALPRSPSRNRSFSVHHTHGGYSAMGQGRVESRQRSAPDHEGLPAAAVSAQISQQGVNEAKEHLVWVGPGKGNYTVEGELGKLEAQPDDCINPPELIASGEPFFKRGFVAKTVYRVGVASILILLLLGCACLMISFFFPQLAGPPVQRRSSDDSSMPWPGASDEDAPPKPTNGMGRSFCEAVIADAAQQNITIGDAQVDGTTGSRMPEHLRWCCGHIQLGCPPTTSPRAP
mmetsp:Transcript_63316/g.182113  ORF Transcript_63316/g.182113 Transcript_63316/m.182113 type:complete len:240 (-) Transcript_63316:139-858(-)